MFTKDITLIVGPLMSGKTILATNLASSYTKGNILYYINDAGAHSIKKRLHALSKNRPLADLTDIKLALEIPKNVKIHEREFDLLDIEFAIMGEEIDYVIIDCINYLKSEQTAYLPKILSIIKECERLSKEYHCRFVLTLNLISTQDFKLSEISDVFPNIDLISLKHKTKELELVDQDGVVKTLKVNRRNLRTTESKILEFD